MLCLSASSLNEPFLIADLVAEIALIQDSHWFAIDVSSSVEGSGFLGPDSVSKTPKEDACLDLARSKMSTPIHDNRAQLSGPEIPGVQIREPGKDVLTVNIALSNSPLFVESWGASIIATNEGWNSRDCSDSS